MPRQTLVLVNTTGRQAASVARVAAALDYHVRAHVHQATHPVARELAQLPNVDVVEGVLDDVHFLDALFAGADEAFINTVSFGDEVKIGKMLADMGKKKAIKHFVYSSMPDHGVFGQGWPSLPLWSVKYAVECYIRRRVHVGTLELAFEENTDAASDMRILISRLKYPLMREIIKYNWSTILAQSCCIHSIPLDANEIGLPATFLYTGIYNNNFTSLPYPMFCMRLQADSSFVWKAPFDPDTPLPWLDAEHDVGPAVLQIFKDGAKWHEKRLALAFELLTPQQVCGLFSRALNRPCSYEYSPKIDIEVAIPTGYREQLQGLEQLFGVANAPYFGLDLQNAHDKTRQGTGAPISIVHEAQTLWGGWRGIEEYAREVFPVEEAANGLTWMKGDDPTAIEMSRNSVHGVMAKFG